MKQPLETHEGNLPRGMKYISRQHLSYDKEFTWRLPFLLSFSSVILCSFLDTPHGRVFSRSMGYVCTIHMCTTSILFGIVSIDSMMSSWIRVLSLCTSGINVGAVVFCVIRRACHEV